jgi:hypothetical protein
MIWSVSRITKIITITGARPFQKMLCVAIRLPELGLPSATVRTVRQDLTNGSPIKFQIASFVWSGPDAYIEEMATTRSCGLLPACRRPGSEPDKGAFPRTHHCVFDVERPGLWRAARGLPVLGRSCAVCQKPRARVVGLSPSYRPCHFLSWEREELDDRPHALLLAARRKSLGPCQLGDTMEAPPKQFR